MTILFQRALLAATLCVPMQLGACGAGGTDGAPEETRPDAGKAGPPALFTSVCSTCHGVAAEGTPRAPELRHPDRAFATWVVRNGREGKGFPAPMIPYPAAVISDADLGKILDWLKAFPVPTTGRDLYLDYCGNCHGADGQGGVVGQSAISSVAAEITDEVRSGEGGTAFGVRNQYMPATPSDELSDAQLDLIFRYLVAL